MTGEANKIIESACGQIMVALKEGKFTREELEFLLELFRRMVESTEKVLGKTEILDKQWDTKRPPCDVVS